METMRQNVLGLTVWFVSFTACNAHGNVLGGVLLNCITKLLFFNEYRALTYKLT